MSAELHTIGKQTRCCVDALLYKSSDIYLNTRVQGYYTEQVLYLYLTKVQILLYYLELINSAR
jgi:hypothetical protein